MVARTPSPKHILVKIDKLGRLLIPQAVREQLGLRPGSTLKLVHENENAIFLEPVREEPKIEMRDGCPVIVGIPGIENLDIVEMIKQDREERIEKISGVGIKK